MTTFTKTIAVTALFLSSAHALSADGDWDKTWSKAEDVGYGGYSYIDSERYNNSGLAIYSRIIDDCGVLFAPIAMLERDETVTYRDNLHGQMRIDGGTIYETQEVEREQEDNILIEAMGLLEGEGFAERLSDNSVIFQVGSGDTDEVSLSGFTKAVGEAVDINAAKAALLEAQDHLRDLSAPGSQGPSIEAINEAATTINRFYFGPNLDRTPFLVPRVFPVDPPVTTLPPPD